MMLLYGNRLAGDYVGLRNIVYFAARPEQKCLYIKYHNLIYYDRFS
jgi:hypothetical protein